MKSLFARLLNIIPSFVHVDNGNGIISKRKRMFLQHDCTPSNTVPHNNLVPGLISTQLPAKLSKITPKFANYLSKVSRVLEAHHAPNTLLLRRDSTNHSKTTVTGKSFVKLCDLSKKRANERSRELSSQRCSREELKNIFQTVYNFNNNFVKIARPSS